MNTRADLQMMVMMIMMETRRYSDLVHLTTFDERFEYLKLNGGVGRATFGFDRYINQQFYKSPFWEQVRNEVMIRDQGCDLGIPGYEIYYRPLVHHMNPLTVQNLLQREDWVLDPEYLILTSHDTHNDIHFGVKKSHPKVTIMRTRGDTKLW